MPARPHLAELSRTLNYVARVGLAKPAVHIVDREADAVRHLRRWHRRGHYVLIRAQSSRLVRYQGQEQRLSSVVAQLQASLSFSRAVEYKGQPATQYVTEAEVTLHRVAKVRRPHTQGREREHIAGPPLPVRLIVSEVRSPEGVVLTQWWLWTNLPAEVSASTVALWYYWRWRIESFFKLLKGAGQHLEQWQQERAAALAKRLMVAVQACVLVWALARADGPQAAATRSCLIRLSGRLMNRSRPWTEPALLAGLWHLLVLLEVVERYPLQDLRAMAAQVLPPA